MTYRNILIKERIYSLIHDVGIFSFGAFAILVYWENSAWHILKTGIKIRAMFWAGLASIPSAPLGRFIGEIKVQFELNGYSKITKRIMTFIISVGVFIIYITIAYHFFIKQGMWTREIKALKPFACIGIISLGFDIYKLVKVIKE